MAREAEGANRRLNVKEKGNKGPPRGGPSVFVALHSLANRT